MAAVPKIEVLGSGCPGCKKLHKLTVEAAGQLGLTGEVAYVTDINRIIEMGVMQTPVLAVNGKPVLAGFIPDVERLKEEIKKAVDA
jgi:small redox-active disulfide protein 2